MTAVHKADIQQRNSIHQNQFSVKTCARCKSPTCQLPVANKHECPTQSLFVQCICQNLTEFSRFPRGSAVGCVPIWSDEHLLEPVPEQAQVLVNYSRPIGGKGIDEASGSHVSMNDTV